MSIQWCQFRESDGVVIRSGRTRLNENILARKGCVTLIGVTATAGKSRIEHDGFDEAGSPKNPRAVSYHKPPRSPRPARERRIRITRGQYEDLLARVAALETARGEAKP